MIVCIYIIGMDVSSNRFELLPIDLIGSVIRLAELMLVLCPFSRYGGHSRRVDWSSTLRLLKIIFYIIRGRKPPYTLSLFLFGFCFFFVSTSAV